MTYRRMLYIFDIITRNHFKMYMFGVVGETHAHDYFEVISFYNSKDIQHSPICHLCNLHIKETEISQKRSKGIKNCKITYSVILSVLSNKTNMVLGFNSPLKVPSHGVDAWQEIGDRLGRRVWPMTQLAYILARLNCSASTDIKKPVFKF